MSYDWHKWVAKLVELSLPRLQAEAIMAAMHELKDGLVTTERHERDAQHANEVEQLKFDSLRADIKSEIQKILVEQARGQQKILFTMAALVLTGLGIVLTGLGILARLYGLI